MRHLRNTLCGLTIGILYAVVCWWIFEGSSIAECRRVVERPDGVSIITPARADQQPSETETDWCQRAFTRAITADPLLQGHPFHDVDSADLPVDRSQRRKWRYLGGKVRVDSMVPDLPPSKEIQRRAVCARIKADMSASSALKELCETF